ncbi:MAG: rhamnosyl O-methyltransferase [Betaproteobacteria bacterium]|nr:MAG: rhamnosyl O-methyltransferase [Betaproteobacteria bacterium]
MIPENSAPGLDYFRWFYDQGVWKRMHYRGVRILKFPCDLWNYQEIFAERGIQWVLETGTRHGGSALFFADLLALNAAAGKVITVDVDPAANAVGTHPRIEFLLGDSGSPDMANLVGSRLPRERGPMFVILDSDHRRAHVLRELQHIVPLMRQGDYLVVEDTCVNGHPLRPDFGPGPYEALEEFLRARPGVLERDVAREQKFGFTFAPRGYLIKT